MAAKVYHSKAAAQIVFLGTSSEQYGVTNHEYNHEAVKTQQ